MATPTPSKAAFQATTPSSFANHLAAFSPAGQGSQGPRSIAQSPAYLAKKSPANATSTQHLTGSTNNSALNFDSPGAAALGLNLHLQNVGSIPHFASRPDDEERRRRIEMILARLARSQVRISEAGVVTLAKRTGLDFFWEDDAEGGARTLNIAGSSLLIEVCFKSNVVTAVNLSFPRSPEPVTATVPLAARILKRDLTPPTGVASINTSLARFGENLERLARLDKLSVQPDLDCYAAIAGIYTSLKKLFDYEKRKVQEGWAGERHGGKAFSDEEYAEREVLCKKSGRPVMHGDRTVGLRLEYWMERRLVPSTPRKDQDGDTTMTSNGEATSHADHAAGHPTIWSLVVECEASPAELYPPVRVSDQWLSDNIEQEPDMLSTMNTPLITWQEPLPTLISDTTGDLGMQGDAALLGKQPNVRFVARLEPPVVVPLPVALQLFNAVGFPSGSDENVPIFDELVLPRKDFEDVGLEGDVREIKTERVVSAYEKDGSLTKALHQYNLCVQKRDYGKVIDEIPFSHPRQLVEILPILRQNVAAVTILHQTLVNVAAHEAEPKNVPEREDHDETTLPDELSAFILTGTSRQPQTPSIETLKVDLTFTAQPTPKIGVTFANHAQPIDFIIHVGPHGDIIVADDETTGGGDGHSSGTGLSAEQVSKAVEVSEGLGTVIEFFRRKAG